MRWRTLIACAVVFAWDWCGRASAQEAELKARVERIIIEMGDPSASVRDRADLKLRNLPLQAYPIVTAIYAKDKDTLDPEAKSRIDSSIEMFRALAVVEERVREYWAWMKENSLKVYDEGNNRVAKWDKSAREAIALATTWPRDASQAEKMRVLCEQAVSAGCEDPLFLYHYSLYCSSLPELDEHKPLEIMVQAATEATSNTDYPAWVKCMITSRLQNLLLRRRDLRVGEIYGRLPGRMSPTHAFQLIKPQDKVPPVLLYEFLDLITRPDTPDTAGYWYEQLSKPFERLAPGSPYLHVFKGSVYRRYAFAGDELRPGKPVVRGEEQREPRLKIAQDELEKAWEMDPRLIAVPNEMLRLAFDRGAEREEIDKWLGRALAVYPDNYQACSLVLEQMAGEEKLEFGRQCLARRNWRGRLAFILIDAHEWLANAAEEKSQYWRRPEVWKDIKQVYETHLELFPQSAFDRSYYALLANRCEQWKEADRQFKILGDKPALKVFGSMTSYNYQRKKAAKNAAQ